MQESKFLSKCPLMLGTYGPDHNGKPTTRSVKANISIHFISFRHGEKSYRENLSQSSEHAQFFVAHSHVFFI